MRIEAIYKKSFFPNLGVGRNIQILEILYYPSGLNFTVAVS